MELARPIRIYWDVSPAQTGDLDYMQICEQLIENKILSLNVVDTGTSVTDACLQILKRVQSEHIATSLVLSIPAATSASVNLLQNLDIKMLYFKVPSLAVLRSHSDLFRHPRTKGHAGVYFEVTKANFVELPDVVAFCIDKGISSLALPMQRLIHDKDPFYLPKSEGKRLATRLASIALPSSLQLVIHDPFLWKIFFPTAAFPEGGCQAANTMLYISPEGDVYPCPSMPVKLGNLRSESFRDIIASREKKALRRQLLAYPEGCRTCDELVHCKGGCRGRALTCYASFAEPDPGCR